MILHRRRDTGNPQSFTYPLSMHCWVCFLLAFNTTLQGEDSQCIIGLDLVVNVCREVLEAEKKGSTVEMKLAKITNEVAATQVNI